MEAARSLAFSFLGFSNLVNKRLGPLITGNSHLGPLPSRRVPIPARCPSSGLHISLHNPVEANGVGGVGSFQLLEDHGSKDDGFGNLLGYKACPKPSIEVPNCSVAPVAH